MTRRNRQRLPYFSNMVLPGNYSMDHGCTLTVPRKSQRKGKMPREGVFSCR
jgi:hypothetical protein